MCADIEHVVKCNPNYELQQYLSILKKVKK